MTSSTVQPSPFPRRRASIRPGSATAIFAKNCALTGSYNCSQERELDHDCAAGQGGGADFFALLAAATRRRRFPKRTTSTAGFADWDLDVVHYWGIDVRAQGLKAEVHAARVLEGRAVQDVWIMPRFGERRAGSDPKMNMYGTTLRSWDPSIQAWRIAWTNPAGGHREEQVGRWNGRDILQEGTRPDGRRRAGPSRRSPRTRFTGAARRCIPARRRGRSKANFSHQEADMSTMTTGNQRSLLSRILREGYGDGACYGPALKAALADVTSGAAFRRPAPGRHNIAEIALHHAYHIRGVRAKLTGVDAEPFVLEGDDWFALDDESTMPWPKILEVVGREQKRLAQVVADLPSPSVEGPGFDLILGITCHAVYHAGQIQLIKKLAAQV